MLAVKYLHKDIFIDVMNKNFDITSSPSGSSQGEVFLGGEADEYFSRNHSRVDISPARQLLGEWCNPHKKDVGRILEIGAGNGIPLAYLCNVLDAQGFGIEPSKKAVENWSLIRGDIAGGASASLRVGLANEIPFEDKSFDLVIFGFCLYLVDRSLLYRAIAEADRVLRDGGFLGIEDFDSPIPYSNKYCHKEGILSYKSDYSNIFTSSGHYHLISKHSYSHTANHFDTNFAERVSLSFLYKQENAVYG